MNGNRLVGQPTPLIVRHCRSLDFRSLKEEWTWDPPWCMALGCVMPLCKIGFALWSLSGLVFACFGSLLGISSWLFVKPCCLVPCMPLSWPFLVITGLWNCARKSWRPYVLTGLEPIQSLGWHSFVDWRLVLPTMMLGRPWVWWCKPCSVTDRSCNHGLLSAPEVLVDPLMVLLRRRCGYFPFWTGDCRRLTWWRSFQGWRFLWGLET